MSQEIDYLNPALPPGLRRASMPVVDATPIMLDGFGRLMADPSECPIGIVQWPAVGSRPIDPGTGDEAGTTEVTFVSEWRGDILYGRNEAVGGNYVLPYASEPEAVRDDNANAPERMLLWHANCHPDGGQLFFPLDHRPFYVPLALPGATSRQRSSCTFASMHSRVSTSIQTSGMKVCSRLGGHNGSLTGRAPSTRASLPALPASLAVFSRRRLPVVRPAYC
jgi:hypothetical protein